MLIIENILSRIAGLLVFALFEAILVWFVVKLIIKQPIPNEYKPLLFFAGVVLAVIGIYGDLIMSIFKRKKK